MGSRDFYSFLSAIRPRHRDRLIPLGDKDVMLRRVQLFQSIHSSVIGQTFFPPFFHLKRPVQLDHIHRVDILLSKSSVIEYNFSPVFQYSFVG